MKREAFFSNLDRGRFNRLFLRFNSPNNFLCDWTQPISPANLGTGFQLNRNGSITVSNGPTSPTRWKDAENIHNFDDYFQARARADAATLTGGSYYILLGFQPALGVFTSWTGLGEPFSHEISIRREVNQAAALVDGTLEIRYRDFPSIVISRTFRCTLHT